MAEHIDELVELWDKGLETAGSTSGSQRRTADKSGATKKSIRESFYSDIDNWDGKSGKTFTVGRTSEVLKSLGAKDSLIQWHSRKIVTILSKHKNITRDIIKQVPQILEDPVVVLTSKQSDSRLVMFGSVKDAEGKPVTAILELQPTNIGGEVEDINIVVSSYGKDNAKGFIESSGLVYIDPNRNRTESWLHGLRLQLPSDTTAFGSVRRISYQDGKVKIDSVPYLQYMQGRKKNAVKYQKRSFSDQVDDVLAGISLRGNSVYVGETPDILGDIGLNTSLPMLTTENHIRKAAMPKNDKKHQHGLTKEQLKSLPDKIANPALLMDSLNRNSNSVIAVTDMLDSDGSPIIAVIRADGEGRFNNITIESNFLTSYYGRDGFDSFIHRAVESDSVLYINKEKATTLAAGPSSQWLGELKGYDFNVIIRKSSVNVNGKQSSTITEKGSGRFTSQGSSKVKNSLREGQNLTYDALVSKPDMPITVMGDKIPSNRKDIIAEAKRRAEAFGSLDENNSVRVQVKDNGREVLLSTNGLKHGLDRRLSEDGLVTLYASELLHNAIEVNEFYPKQDGTSLSYALIGVANTVDANGAPTKTYIVRFIVNRHTDVLTSVDVLYAINAKKERPAALNAPRASTPGTDLTISIADLLDVVKKHFPDILPMDVLRHYGVETRPKGELGTRAKYSRRDNVENNRIVPDEVRQTKGFVGVREDGIEVYETSDTVKNMKWKDRKKQFLKIMKEQYRGRTARFHRNGHTYYATFSPVDIEKTIYGDNVSDQSGKDAKVKTGADGNIFNLVENSEFFGSMPERGEKKGRAHSKTIYWDYFLKTVQIDNTVFDVLANVRKEPGNFYVYSIELYENKNIEAASPPGLAFQPAFVGVPTTSDDSILERDDGVNRKYSYQDI